MVTFGLGCPEPEPEPSATATGAELAALTAATAMLRPLASTAELAIATITRVRICVIAIHPPGTRAHEWKITLCNVDADKNILTGIKGDGQRRVKPSPQLVAASYPSGRDLMSHQLYFISV
jgi:hypothetical protein